MQAALSPPRAGAIAATAAAAAHAGALGAGFVFDDIPYYVQSRYLQSLGGVFGVLGDGYWESGELSWRPVAVAIQVLQRSLLGATPLAHAVSVILHAAVAWLIVRWLIDLKLPPAAALAGAACFAVHPALSEAVVQVSFAEDLWAALFLLLSVRVVARGPAAWGRAAAAAGFAFLAMGAKESALVFPVCWWLTAMADKPAWERNRLPTVVAGTTALAAFVLLRFVVFRNPLPSGVGQLPNLISGDLWILGRYGTVLVAPWSLCADYSVPAEVAPAGWLLGLALPLVATVAAWRVRAAVPGMLWFGAALLPVMNLVPLSTPAAERFLYLPAIGLAWAVAVFWDRSPPAKRRAALWVLCGLVVAGAARSQVRARDYDSPERFWSATLEVNPHSFRAMQNLGGIRMEQGKHAEAVALYRKRLELYPDQPDGRFSLALALRQWSFASPPGSIEGAKRLLEAERLLRAELARWPDAWKARVLLADLEVGRGRFREALATLDMVPSQHCDSVYFIQTKVAALMRANRATEAHRLLEWGLQLHPDHPGLSALARALGR